MAIAEVDGTRQRILEAAGGVFAQKGFDGATVRDICQAAGANVASVNYYFGDKQRLYLETVKWAHANRLRQVPLPTWPEGTPPEERLRDFVTAFLERLFYSAEQPWHCELMMRELAHPSEACAEVVRSFIREQFLVLQAILSELLPQGISETKRHLIAFGIVGQCLHYRIADPVIRLLVPAEEFATYQVQLLAEHITSWTLAALGRQPALAAARAMAANPESAAAASGINSDRGVV
jgi:TetR/AcrR family transcriptional regulator, regulator of cefoperazone and chloramphenicol sensitivity